MHCGKVHKCIVGRCANAFWVGKQMHCGNMIINAYVHVGFALVEYSIFKMTRSLFLPADVTIIRCDNNMQ